MKEAECSDQTICNTDEDISLASLKTKMNIRMCNPTPNEQSTDGDIPLSSYVAKLLSEPRSLSPFHDSDRDEEYQPTKADVNSSDSEDLSVMTMTQIQIVMIHLMDFSNAFV